MIPIYCNGCKHIKLCKHYEYLCKYPELVIFSCALREEPTKEIIREETNVTPLRLIKKEKTEPIYNAPELKECPCCNSKTYGEIYKCCKCGTSICDSCAYYGDSDLSNDGNVAFNEYICEECYEDMYSDETISEETSIFELLTSNFESEDK